MNTGEKTAPPAYRTAEEGNTSPHILSMSEHSAAYHLRCNHDICAHSVSNMPLRVSSRTSAQVKHLNGSMRIGAAISTVRARSKVNAIESSPCGRNAVSVSLESFIRHMRCYREAPDTETREITTEILLYMQLA